MFHTDNSSHSGCPGGRSGRGEPARPRRLVDPGAAEDHAEGGRVGRRGAGEAVRVLQGRRGPPVLTGVDGLG